MPKARAIDAFFDEMVHQLLRDGEPRRLLVFACERVAALYEFPLVGLRSFPRGGGRPFAVVQGAAAALVADPVEPRLDWAQCAEAGVASAITLPVRMGGRLAAAMSLFAPERDAFGIATVANLASIGRRMAVLLEIAESQQRMRLLSVALEAAANAVFITHVDGTILWCNAAFAKMSGYSLADVVGRNPRILKSDAHGERFFSGVWNTIKAGQVWSGEVVERHRGGHKYVVQQTITPMLDEAGAVTHFIAIHEEVTERKRLEQELRDARDRALDAARLRSAFLANMSHEVRTPMNGVLGMLELLSGTELGAEQRHYLEVARRSARTLLDSLNEILDYSQLESAGVRLDPVDSDLYSLLDDVIDTLAGAACDKAVDLYYRVGPEAPCCVHLDPVRVRQVLTNLVGNALKFTERGEVEVRLAQEPRGLLFSVRDTGIGIEAEACRRIFEPFQQADLSTTRRYGGSGLGLAICRELIEQMGGEIGVESTPGEGSRFWFTIPLVAAECAGPAVPLEGVRALLIGEEEPGIRALGELAATLGMRPLHATVAELRTAWPGDGFDLALVCVPAATAADLLPPDLPAIDVVPPGRAALLGDRPRLHRPVSRRHLRDVVEAALGRMPALAAGEAGQLTGRVLVVEDNPVGRQVATAMLSRLGVSHAVAEDGRAAVARVAEGGVDLVLMDCQMPGMDGFQATGLIRRMERERGRPRLPIVALTAHTRPDEAERCAAAEMDGYVGKPLDLETLRQLLARFLLRREAGGRTQNLVEPFAVRQLEELDAEDAAGIIDLFLHDAPLRLAQLRAAAAAGECERAAQVLHTLRGSSASVGAAELVRICADGEALIRRGGEECDLFCSQAEAALDAVRPELERLRQRLMARAV